MHSFNDLSLYDFMKRLHRVCEKFHRILCFIAPKFVAARLERRGDGSVTVKSRGVAYRFISGSFLNTMQNPGGSEPPECGRKCIPH